MRSKINFTGKSFSHPCIPQKLLKNKDFLKNENKTKNFSCLSSQAIVPPQPETNILLPQIQIDKWIGVNQHTHTKKKTPSPRG